MSINICARLVNMLQKHNKYTKIARPLYIRMQAVFD